MRPDATEHALRAARRSSEARAAVISATSARELAECDERFEAVERRHVTELEVAHAEMEALRDELAGGPSPSRNRPLDAFMPQPRS